MISLKWFKKRESLLSFLAAFSAVLLGVLAPAFSYAEKPPDVPADLTRLTLEELMEIQVTSVSKGGENLSKAASAIFVLTQEDLRRSGVNTIPEALRMVPIDNSLMNLNGKKVQKRPLEVSRVKNLNEVSQYMLFL